MKDRNLPALYLEDAAGATPDGESDTLPTGDPWLDSLEPFEIEWELIWVM